MKEVSLNVNDLKWQPAHGYSAGVEEKVLCSGDSAAPRTILLKIPSGWSMESHSHISTELHYVLEGEYESKGEVYSAGTFRIIQKEVEHGPFTSRTGATVLVTWCTLCD